MMRALGEGIVLGSAFVGTVLLWCIVIAGAVRYGVAGRFFPSNDDKPGDE